MIRVSPLTPSIYKQLEPDPPPYSVRGYAVMDKEQVICAACIMRVGANQFLMFVGENLKLYRRYLIHGWSLIKPLLNKNTFVIQNDEISTAEGFIRHFGFEHIEEDIWQWHG